MIKVPGIAYRAVAPHLTFFNDTATTEIYTGAVTLIERFGSALKLNCRCSGRFLDDPK
jgi:hypothetical protein